MSEKVGLFKAIGNYFKDVRSELRKVVYPTAKQVINNTIVVIVAIVVIGTFIALLDGAFGWGRNKLFAKNLTTTQDGIDWSQEQFQFEGEEETTDPGAESDVDLSNAQQLHVDEDGNITVVDPEEAPPADGEVAQ